MESIQFIVARLNEPPFSKNLRLVSATSWLVIIRDA